MRFPNVGIRHGSIFEQSSMRSAGTVQRIMPSSAANEGPALAAADMDCPPSSSIQNPIQADPIVVRPTIVSCSMCFSGTMWNWCYWPGT
jgi:hypothetical protein